jgi:hypothetical protein
VPVGVAVERARTGCWTNVVGVDRESGVDVESDVTVAMGLTVAEGARAVWV